MDRELSVQLQDEKLQYDKNYFAKSISKTSWCRNIVEADISRFNSMLHAACLETLHIIQANSGFANWHGDVLFIVKTLILFISFF